MELRARWNSGEEVFDLLLTVDLRIAPGTGPHRLENVEAKPGSGVAAFKLNFTEPPFEGWRDTDQ
jgi:hypothetical protein